MAGREDMPALEMDPAALHDMVGGLNGVASSFEGVIRAAESAFSAAVAQSWAPGPDELAREFTVALRRYLDATLDELRAMADHLRLAAEHTVHADHMGLLL